MSCRTRALLTLALSASLTLTACSGNTSSQPSDSPAPTVGTLTPPAEIQGLDTLGLSRATLSTAVEPDLSNTRSEGLTYVTPRTDPAAALEVIHAGWDGTQTWTGTVTPPTDVPDPAAYTPQFSYDDEAGVVAYWYTLDQWDSAEDRPEAIPLNSPLTWFDLTSGASGTASVGASEGNPVLSAAPLVGAIEVSATDGVVWSLDGARDMVSTTFQQIGLPEGNYTLRGSSSGGSVFIKAPASAGDGTWSVYRDTTEALTGLSETSTTTVTEEGMVVVDWDASRMWSFDGATATEIDTASCSLQPGEVRVVGAANGYLYAGQLLVSPEGTSTCLSPALDGGTQVIRGVLSDGRAVLSSEATNEDGLLEYTVATADGTSMTPVGAVSPFVTTGGYLVFHTTAEDGTLTVTAFSEKDLAIGQ